MSTHNIGFCGNIRKMSVRLGRKKGLIWSYIIVSIFQAGRSLMEFQNQAKQLFRKISSDPQPPARCSLESGPFIFQ